VLKIIDCHVDQIYSLAINRDGSLIATTSKDKQLRIIEPRNAIVVAQGMCHNGTKCSKVVFLSDNKVLTTGFSKHSDRQYAIWNQHDLKKPLIAADIDSASGIMQPFFDYETKTIYLCGKGEGTIRYYEIVDEAPYIFYLNQFISGQPQKSLGWMPKRALDVSSCEIFRFYKIHASGNVVEPVSFIVPRKSTLFQADIYPDTLSTKPAMTSYEWFSLNSNVKPILMSMQQEPSPNGVVAAMQKKVNLINSQTTIATKVKDEENKIRRQTEIIETRVSKAVSDNNMVRKFAFLSQETVPDYRERIQNKEEKTNTNQSTKIQQLQSIFGGQQPHYQQQQFKEKEIEIISIADNAEKEVKKKTLNLLKL
jgi:coronin-2